MGEDPRLVEAGWDDLAGGRWQAARQAFIAALRENETPEAHEGLSWAAWWLDDADTVFASRGRAFELYREQGQSASAARMATWLAADQLDFHGALSVASGWLRRARRLLQPLEPGADHGWLAFHEGYVAYVRGDADGAMDSGRRAAELGRRSGTPDLEMLGLSLEGAVLVSRADVEDGMACLDEAVASALGAQTIIPISRAWACCFLVGACETVRDYRRAFEWCDRIAEFAERYGSRYMLAFCRAHYAAVSLWRGNWSRAEAELEAAAQDYARSRPAFLRGVNTKLAELRRRQGDTENAERLLADAAGAEALLCRARLAVDRGEWKLGMELAERSLRQRPEQQRLERATALELLVRGRARLGQIQQAESALEELRRIERAAATLPLRAAVRLGEGLIRGAAGAPEDARPALEDAVDLFERSDAPYEAAQARVDLASVLAALGRTGEAEREVAAAVAVFTRLGAAVEVDRARRLDAPSPDGTAPRSRLTRRQREVLELICEGLTNREIADRLVVSEHTVHRHVTNILRRLDLPTRAAAAAHAVRSGVIDTPPT